MTSSRIKSMAETQFVPFIVPVLFRSLAWFDTVSTKSLSHCQAYTRGGRKLGGFQCSVGGLWRRFDVKSGRWRESSLLSCHSLAFPRSFLWALSNSKLSSLR